MRPGWTNFHPWSYFVSSQPSHLSSLLVHCLFFITFILLFPPEIIPTSSVSSTDFFSHSVLFLLPLFFPALSLLQCFHPFRLIPPAPLPRPIHIFKHKPAHWFQTKCVHSNISIDWVGKALKLIRPTTLWLRHVWLGLWITISWMETDSFI